MKFSIAITIFAATAVSLCLASCKNNNKDNGGNRGKDSETNQTSTVNNTAEAKTIDVEYLANLYCKVTDLDKCRLFLGKDTNSLFAVQKDVENNYASVYARTQYQNTLEFYMWTDSDGEKILGVNVTECGEKGHNRRSLQFFTYDSKLNLAVPCKRLNEIITNKMLSMRRSFSSFILKIPTSPENENIILQYYDKQKKYHELVFVWDGKQFNV